MKANLTFHFLHWGAWTLPAHTNLSTPAFAGHLADSAFDSFCLPSGDANAITQALHRGGAGAQVHLCPGAIFLLTEPVAFSAARQAILTHGTPTGSTRAALHLGAGANGTAIVADCDSCEAPTVSHLVIEGNAFLEPLQPPERALVFFGENASEGTLSHVAAYDAHAHSFFEMSGDIIDCRGLKLTNNLFRTSNAPLISTSGMTVRCAHSLVAENVVEGIGEVGLQLIDSPGSIVRDNLFQTAQLAMRSGIAVVLTPLSRLAGHPRGAPIARRLSPLSALQLIKNNRISNPHEYMEAGIAVSVVGNFPRQIEAAGSANVGNGFVALDKNVITGRKMGHAIVISANFLVQAMNNRATGQFLGIQDDSCGETKPSARLAFVSDERQRKDSLQAEFSLGRFSPKRCFVPSAPHVEL